MYALSNVLGSHAPRAAPTGMAPFLIGGSTLHSLLRLHARGGQALQGDGLKNLQVRLGGVKYIIVDKLSRISQAQMV